MWGISPSQPISSLAGDFFISGAPSVDVLFVVWYQESTTDIRRVGRYVLL